VLKFPIGHFMIPIHIAGSNPFRIAKDDTKEPIKMISSFVALWQS